MGPGTGCDLAELKKNVATEFVFSSEKHLEHNFKDGIVYLSPLKITYQLIPAVWKQNWTNRSLLILLHRNLKICILGWQ